MFRNKKTDKRKIITVSIIVLVFIAALLSLSSISDLKLWDMLDEIQRKYFPNTIINELIIRDPEMIERRVNRDVDRAIDEVTPEYDHIINEENKKYEPRYIEEKNDDKLCYSDECKKLAPPIRKCAPWVEDCINSD